MNPWLRFGRRIAIIVAAVWISGWAIHPGAGVAVAVGSMIWLAIRYDNHTGSLLLLTLVLLVVLLIILALLMFMVARASA
ncbi:hypothetical protein D1610_12625 [Sphingomonas gilva]|uniref:Uncharacterized protein n=1 Tax=Sphingomonas gilva TaxID=2305907 RepID=A0A396RMR7_9SPHN|nr:hypothetical protein [Sphingomonas gilva]RHW16976.1 hypothetical protein D1610_12625 [Sphingomonas gilva]